MRPLFGTSGVRGVFGKELTVDLCNEVAKALATILPSDSKVCVASDTRVSRDIIKQAIISGLQSCGVQPTDLGILPTPALALLTRESGFDSGIMITASHNPPEFNGIKLFNGNTIGYSQNQEQQIEKVYIEKSFRYGNKKDVRYGDDSMKAYLRFIESRLSFDKVNKNLKIVIDPGNGAASGFVSSLFKEIGLKILTINDTPDGNFPGRNPEPKEDTLRNTVRFLRDEAADLAICFDGDADRVVFCDREGFIGFNELIAFISRLAIKETGKQKVASTVETGRLLDLAVQDLSAEVIRGRVGDVNVAHLVNDNDAAIGVEQVGVYIIPEAGYYPDSIYAALLLLSKINDVAEIRDFFKGLPGLSFEKKKIECPNDFKEKTMQAIEAKADLLKAKEVNTLDGLRFEYDDSWMLIRASGTEPAIRIIAESTSSVRTQELLEKGEKLVNSSIKGGE